jgi:hypothetical protein
LRERVRVRGVIWTPKKPLTPALSLKGRGSRLMVSLRSSLWIYNFGECFSSGISSY